MPDKDECFLYTTEERQEDGSQAVMLEGWRMTCTTHVLIAEYGRLYPVSVKDMPNILETGDGSGYVPEKKVFDKFRIPVGQAPVPGHHQEEARRDAGNGPPRVHETGLQAGRGHYERPDPGNDLGQVD